MFGFPVEPGQHAAGRIEDLEKAVVLEVGDVVVPHEVDGILAALVVALIDAGIVHGGDDVAARGRELGHEPHAQFAPQLAPEGAPRDLVLGADGGLRLDVDDGVQALVVQRPIHVQAQGLAVGRKGMAVGAGVQSFHQQATLLFGDVAQPPGDQRNGLRGQRLDHAFLVLGRHERHVPIEDGRPNRILRGSDGDLSARGHVIRTGAMPGDDDRGGALHRVLFEGDPRCKVRRPGMRSSLRGR